MQNALAQGVLVHGQWQLVRQLGEGGMGSVWEAESLRLGGRVAIKFLSRQHLQDERVRRRFEREARSLSKVRSPHVVQILDQGVTNEGVPFIVTELLEGEDLGCMLERQQTLNVPETAMILDHVCRGVAKVHAAGLVHRDIKPENVFIIHESDGRHFVKLLDFGVAKCLAADSVRMTERDMVLGTAHYVSPEQISTPQQVDHRADIWAIGVLAHRMLTGVVPFDADNWVTLCHRVLEAKLAPVQSLRPGLPAELDGWFRKTMHPDVRARFQTAEEARTGFERIARTHSSGVVAKTPARLEPPQRGVAVALDIAPGKTAGGQQRLRRWGAVGLIATALGILALWFAFRTATPQVVAPVPAPAAHDAAEGGRTDTAAATQGQDMRPLGPATADRAEIAAEAAGTLQVQPAAAPPMAAAASPAQLPTATRRPPPASRAPAAKHSTRGEAKTGPDRKYHGF